jgi:hypothetical protein
VYGFSDDTKLPKADSPVLISPSDLRLGETALALTGNGFAATGIVSRVSADGVYTTLPDVGAGNAVVNLSGNLIGIGSGTISGTLISAGKITTLLLATSTTATSTSPQTP